VEAACARGVVARAAAACDEAADVLVAPGERPTLLIRLLPATLSQPERAQLLLRRELLHVADVLDPDFGYAPAASAPRLEAHRVERYRVLWDASVDGRLLRSGRAPSRVRAERESEFARAFPALGGRTAELFRRFFDGERCTHGELVAFASEGTPLGGVSARCLTDERMTEGRLAHPS
jgi:hypothetical protein